MIIKNIYLRLIAGTFWIAMGLVSMKIYIDRDKESVWGNLYRMSEEMMQGSQGGLYTGKIFLIIGVLSIIGGLIAIVYGFRSTLVG